MLGTCQSGHLCAWNRPEIQQQSTGHFVTCMRFLDNHTLDMSV